VGKVADGIIVHKQSPDGDGEQLELFNLVRVKRSEPLPPSGTEPTEPQLLCESEPQAPTEPLAETEPEEKPRLELPEVFQHRNPLVWDLLDDWLRENLHPSDREQIRLMLAYAELNDYPELPVPDLNYTIRGSMGGWLTAAKHFAGSPTILLLTELLYARAKEREQQATG
jgi:hypothetical protein